MEPMAATSGGVCAWSPPWLATSPAAACCAALRIPPVVTRRTRVASAGVSGASPRNSFVCGPPSKPAASIAACSAAMRAAPPPIPWSTPKTACKYAPSLSAFRPELLPAPAPDTLFPADPPYPAAPVVTAAACARAILDLLLADLLAVLWGGAGEGATDAEAPTVPPRLPPLGLDLAWAPVEDEEDEEEEAAALEAAAAAPPLPLAPPLAPPLDPPVDTCMSAARISSALGTVWLACLELGRAVPPSSAARWAAGTALLGLLSISSVMLGSSVPSSLGCTLPVRTSALARLTAEFQRFLQAFSGRPGTTLATSVHRVPTCATPWQSVSSSASVHGPCLMSGHSWLNHRSLHCLPSLPLRVSGKKKE